MKLEINKQVSPLGNYLFIMKGENPYKNIYSSTGLLTQTTTIFGEGDGASGSNNDLVEFIKFGYVVEVGPECKSVRIGDEIYYDQRSVLPMPFGDLTTVRVHENSVLAIVREETE